MLRKKLIEDILKKFEDCAECFKERDMPLWDLISSHISEIRNKLNKLTINHNINS